MGHYFINDDKLISDIKEYQVKIENTIFKFKTDNGVFSKGELDYGTELLIQNILKLDLNGKVLDLGCGYGPIGNKKKKILDVNVSMCDINKRAIHLSKMNAKKNNVIVNIIESDGYENIDDKFNYIISSLPKNWGQWKSGVGVPMGFQLMKCGTGSLSPHL